MDMKTVSVVMCTYNGEKYLREQINSILAQTYPLYELIIRDDCSTDNTVNILKEYEEKYSFIKVYFNECNRGCNQNFHDTIYQASGDYIAISDQDDIWFPTKIEKQMKKIIEEKKDMCFSDIISSSSYTVVQEDNYVPLPFTAECLLFRDTIPGHSMLIRREFLETLCDWSGMTFYYDWWLAMNAALLDSIVKYEEPLVWHRIHPESAIAVALNMQSELQFRSRIAPYILGINSFFKLRKTKSWQCFYKNVYDKTSAKRHPVLHKITKLFNSNNPFAIIELCLTCMKYRYQVYPLPHTSRGFLFALRGFFSPFICSYYNIQFL